MCLYALTIFCIKQFFCGNEHLASKSYLFIYAAILAFGFISITYFNIKTMVLE